MSIKSEKLAKFKSIITINSASVNPARADFSETSLLQAQLDSDRDAAEILGMDFLMFAERGLFSEREDLKKATGIFNFAQAITHRLSTFRGTMPGDPLFGVPWGRYLGRTYKNKALVLADLREDILNEVEKDRRTGSIPRLQVDFFDANTVEIDITIIPIFTSLEEAVNITLTGGV